MQSLKAKSATILVFGTTTILFIVIWQYAIGYTNPTVDASYVSMIEESPNHYNLTTKHWFNATVGVGETVTGQLYGIHKITYLDGEVLSGPSAGISNFLFWNRPGNPPMVMEAAMYLSAIHEFSEPPAYRIWYKTIAVITSDDPDTSYNSGWKFITIKLM